jgi:cytochrome c oxidase cbb3-type subunit 3
MSSPFRISTAAAALALAACHGPPKGEQALSQTTAPLPTMSTLYPGGAPPSPPQDLSAFASDPGHIANGKRLYVAYNCNGCHFNGGGGIGPAFMDQSWTYGGELQDIHASIAEGRPNGMPVWGRKIPDTQIWEIAAYVHSLSPPPVAVVGAQNPSPPPPQPATTSNGKQSAAGG